MNLDDANKILSTYSFSIKKDLISGLEEGTYDEQLIIDIGVAFKNWLQRQDEIEEPWCVWFFDGSSWSKVTGQLYKEDAYKEWYSLTKGGKEQSSPKNNKYYYIGLVHKEPEVLEEEEDDFSIGYLLNKSFGD